MNDARIIYSWEGTPPRIVRMRGPHGKAIADERGQWTVDRFESADSSHVAWTRPALGRRTAQHVIASEAEPSEADIDLCGKVERLFERLSGYIDELVAGRESALVGSPGLRALYLLCADLLVARGLAEPALADNVRALPRRTVEIELPPTIVLEHGHRLELRLEAALALRGRLNAALHFALDDEQLEAFCGGPGAPDLADKLAHEIAGAMHYGRGVPRAKVAAYAEAMRTAGRVPFNPASEPSADDDDES